MPENPEEPSLLYKIWLISAAIAAVYMFVDTFLHGLPRTIDYVLMAYVLIAVIISKSRAKKKAAK